MKILRNIALLCATSALVACATTTPTPDPTPDPIPDPFAPAVSGVSSEDAGVYSIMQDGTTTTLAGETSDETPNLTVWFEDTKTWVYDGTNVLAIAGMTRITDLSHAGIDGTLATSIPETGMASYIGEYGATYYRGGISNGIWWVVGDFAADVDFDSGTISGTGSGIVTPLSDTASSLAISGDLDGANFNGVAVFDALESGGPVIVPMTGGLYGEDTVAGVFEGDTVAGVFFGIEP